VSDLASCMLGKPALARVSVSGNQLGAIGLARLQAKLAEGGLEDRLEEVEDNEEPDEDEDDPELSEEEEEEAKPATPKAAFSFTPSTTSNTAATSLFGAAGASPVPGGSVFGTSAASGSLFGGSASSPFKPAGNIFAAAPAPANIFSPARTEATSVFSATPSSTPTSIFSKPADSPASTGLFGKPAAQSSGPVFGGLSSPATVSSTTEPLKEAPVPDMSVFGSSSAAAFNFTALAGASGEGIRTAGDGFKFSGAGSSLFSSPPAKGEGEEGEEGEDNHDPYFEPIVPLPELVEVKTGEEEEEVPYKYRAKVYRY